jgi:hypothetical protein
MKFSFWAFAALVAAIKFGTVQALNITNSISPADAISLTQNTLATLGLRGSATIQAQTQAQRENALFPVLNAPSSFFPVLTSSNTPQFASGLNSVNANFASVFANFNWGGFGN